VDLGERFGVQPEIAPVPVTALEPPTTAINIAPLVLPPSEPGELDRKRAQIDALAGNDPVKTADFLRSLMDDRQPV
jgi:flagellar M-ring protein FliF